MRDRLYDNVVVNGYVVWDDLRDYFAREHNLESRNDVVINYIHIENKMMTASFISKDGSIVDMVRIPLPKMESVNDD